jgi:hypothetical protein
MYSDQREHFEMAEAYSLRLETFEIRGGFKGMHPKNKPGNNP